MLQKWYKIEQKKKKKKKIIWWGTTALYWVKLLLTMKVNVVCVELIAYSAHTMHTSIIFIIEHQISAVFTDMGSYSTHIADLNLN